MDRLLNRVRVALAGATRVPEPPAQGPSGLELGGDLLAAFRVGCEQAGTRFVHLPDPAAADLWVGEFTAGRRTVRVEDAPDEEALRAADVGVDRADLLVAETGTVVRSYASRHESRVSLVPPVTVFRADTSLLVRDLPAALERLEAAHGAGRAYTLLVTGPSRTADIEKQLVIPAHGPREVVVVVATIPA